jgi:hypothetical protein
VRKKEIREVNGRGKRNKGKESDRIAPESGKCRRTVADEAYS